MSKFKSRIFSMIEIVSLHSKCSESKKGIIYLLSNAIKTLFILCTKQWVHYLYLIYRDEFKYILSLLWKKYAYIHKNTCISILIKFKDRMLLKRRNDNQDFLKIGTNRCLLCREESYYIFEWIFIPVLLSRWYHY